MADLGKRDDASGSFLAIFGTPDHPEVNFGVGLAFFGVAA
jgi:hypothetical protein